MRFEERGEQEKGPCRLRELPDQLARLQPDPSGLGVLRVDHAAIGIFTRTRVLHCRICRDCRLRIVLLSPADVVGIRLGRGHAVVEFHVVEPGGSGMCAGWRVVMQLAHGTSLIPGILEAFLEEDLRPVTRGVIHPVLVRMRIAAREVADSRRHTNRRLHEGSGKRRRLRGEPVEIGRLDEPVAIRAEAVVALLIGHHEQNVRR